MKRLVIPLLFVLSVLSLCPPAWAYGIVNNSGTSSEDSLTVPVLCLDSLGNPTTCDSFFVVTIKSGADAVIFRDSGTIAMTGLDSVTMAGKTYYYFHRAVADIDGAGAMGQFAGIVTAKKNTGTLLTANRFTFQITSNELSDIGDSVGIGTRGVQDHSNWTVATVSQVGTGGISATSLAADCITAAKIATGAIGASEIDVDAIGASEIAPNAIAASEIADNAIGTSEFATALIQAIRDSIWNTAFAYGFVAGSMGDSLSNATYVQGAASGLTASQVWSYASRSAVPADTNTKGDTLAAMGTNQVFRLRQLRIIGSSGTEGAVEIYDSTGSGIHVAGGSGVYIEGNPYALYCYGQDAGAYFYAYNPTGAGVVMRGPLSGGDGLKLMHYGTAYRDLQASKIDSGAFQGAASGLTAADIWAYDGGRHIDGGYVDSNLTEQGGIIGGDKHLAIYVVDTSGVNDTLDGVFLTVQNASGVVEAGLETNSSGRADVIVTDGVWLLLASKHGYRFSETTVNVTANDTVGVLGHDVAVPASSTALTRRVYGYIWDVNGRPEAEARVTAYLPGGVARSGNVIVSPFSVATMSDSTGFFFLDLVPSDSLIPSGAVYEVTISRQDGTILRRRLEVPDLPTWPLAW